MQSLPSSVIRILVSSSKDRGSHISQMIEISFMVLYCIKSAKTSNMKTKSPQNLPEITYLDSSYSLLITFSSYFAIPASHYPPLCNLHCNIFNLYWMSVQCLYLIWKSNSFFFVFFSSFLDFRLALVRLTFVSLLLDTACLFLYL